MLIRENTVRLRKSKTFISFVAIFIRNVTVRPCDIEMCEIYYGNKMLTLCYRACARYGDNMRHRARPRYGDNVTH